MFTLDHIASIHAKVKSGADFPRYVQKLKAIGMSYYDFFVEDGHSEYISVSGQHLHAPSKYPIKVVKAQSNADVLRHTIHIHQQGQTDFLTFCEQAAEAGVQYWRTDVLNLKCIYVDLNGNEFVVEPIPDASSY